MFPNDLRLLSLVLAPAAFMPVYDLKRSVYRIPYRTDDNVMYDLSVLPVVHLPTGCYSYPVPTRSTVALTVPSVQHRAS